MDESEGHLANNYDICLVHPTTELDEVVQHHILRSVLNWAVGIHIKFPRTTSNHRQLRVVEGKVFVNLLTRIGSGLAILDRNAECGLAITVHVDAALPHLSDVGESHLLEVRAKGAHRITEHVNLHILTTTNDG